MKKETGLSLHQTNNLLLNRKMLKAKKKMTTSQFISLAQHFLHTSQPSWSRIQVNLWVATSRNQRTTLKRVGATSRVTSTATITYR